MTPLNSVIETDAYLTRARKLLNEQERATIVDALAADPLQGVLVKGLRGIRKMRVGLEGRGKRGGGRVIYWFQSADYPVGLLFVFAKNESDDLSAEQRRVLQRVADAIRDDFAGLSS